MFVCPIVDIINGECIFPWAFFRTDVPDRFCNSPLHWATKEDNQPILLALIKGGANVNAKGHIGRTPLHIAVCINCSCIQIDLLWTKLLSIEGFGGKRAVGILRKIELCQKGSKFRMQFCLGVLNNVLHVFSLKLASFLRYYVCEKTHFSEGILKGPFAE